MEKEKTAEAINLIARLMDEKAIEREKYDKVCEALRELMPLAERFNRMRIRDEEWMERTAVIEKAKALLEKSAPNNTNNPGPD